MVGFDRLLNGALRLPPKRVFHLDLTPNPSVLMQLHGRETKAALHRSQAWERLALVGSPDVKSETRQRGAGTAGDGGVRARGLCLYMGE
jgi:hypothetical protein